MINDTTRKRDTELVRSCLQENDPVLLRLLDECRDALSARLVLYYCPVVLDEVVDDDGWF